METSFQSMRFATLLAVFMVYMVYLVMASQFESLRLRPNPRHGRPSGCSS
jgi:multidrug efflux pump subunit AcrB